MERSVRNGIAFNARTTWLGDQLPESLPGVRGARLAPLEPEGQGVAERSQLLRSWSVRFGSDPQESSTVRRQRAIAGAELRQERLIVYHGLCASHTSHAEADHRRVIARCVTQECSPNPLGSGSPFVRASQLVQCPWQSMRCLGPQRLTRPGCQGPSHAPRRDLSHRWLPAPLPAGTCFYPTSRVPGFIARVGSAGAGIPQRRNRGDLLAPENPLGVGHAPGCRLVCGLRAPGSGPGSPQLCHRFHKVGAERPVSGVGRSHAASQHRPADLERPHPDSHRGCCRIPTYAHR